MTSEKLPDSNATPRAITWRSVAIGLFGTLSIALLAPFNDHTLNNTLLVGNNLPMGVVMILFGVILLNAVLSKHSPTRILTTGELTVAFTMMLVSCAVPSSGLMRYWPASEIMPIYFAGSDTEFADLFDSLKMPRWLFPSFEGTGVSQWANESVATGFAHRWIGDDGYPYRAWIAPLMAWSIFVFAMYGALLCFSILVRKQWLENERLAFPLAQIQLALVQQPEKGRAFNSIIGKRSFWIAFWAVCALHVWNGLALYAPKYFVAIPRGFDLSQILSDRPFSFLSKEMKISALYFSVAGVSIFLPSSVSLSLWLFFVLQQIWAAGQGSMTGDGSLPGTNDQHFGGLIAYSLAVIWIGRRRWLEILQNATLWKRGRDVPRYIEDRTAFWVFVGCLGVMVAWLVAAGATFVGAVVSVALLMLGFFMVARFVAEVGLIHGQVQIGMTRPWTSGVLYGFGKLTSPQTFYLDTLLQGVHYDYREVIPVYATHSMKVADETIFNHPAPPKNFGKKMIGLIIVSLVLSYFASAYSSIRNEYAYESTLDAQPQTPIDLWGASDNPRWQIVEPNKDYARGQYNYSYNPAAHWAGGFCLTTLLSALRIRFAWWPLHPIGYLMLGTFPLNKMWFSFFVGWLVKTLIVRFGGGKLYSDSKPFVIGLILGESMAAGFWLVVGLIFHTLSWPHHMVSILPY